MPLQVGFLVFILNESLLIIITKMINNVTIDRNKYNNKSTPLSSKANGLKKK